MAARRLAMDILCGRRGRGGGGPTGADRSLALRISREAQVWRARLDRALEPHCRRPLPGLEPMVRAALRAGAVQLLLMRVPAHAAVSTTVGAMGRHRAAGLVNAVLRRLAERGEPSLEEAPLHVAMSHPEGLVERWLARYGRERTEALLAWDNSPPTIGCCMPPGSPDPPGSSPGGWVDGYRVLERSGAEPTGGLPPGAYVQDEGAALVGRAVSRLAGGRVLDACAAPGGKTHHLQGGGGTVISMDRSVERSALLAENSRRHRWEAVLPLVGDCLAPPFGRLFDCVLVDAPCTNTGVYRRRPDARWRWGPGLLDSCTALQARLLDAAARLVRPGGVLAYSTCSLEPEEGEEAAADLERRRPGLLRLDMPAPPEVVRDGAVCIFPPEHGMDGMYAAAWRRER